MRIRRARPEEEGLLQALDTAAFSHLHSTLTGRPVQVPPRELAYYRFWQKTFPEGLLVAEEEGEVLGYVAVHPRGEWGWVGPLAVWPKVQQRGIGRALMEAGMEALEEQGCRFIGLDTYGENPISVSLYLRLGFGVIGGTLVLEQTLPFPLAEVSLTLEPLDEVAWGSLREEVRTKSGFDRAPEVRFCWEWEEGCAWIVRRGGRVLACGLGAMKRGMGTVGGCAFWCQGEERAQAEIALLQAAQDFFLRRGVSVLQWNALANDLESVQRLFRWGFRTRRLMTRMVRPPTFPLRTDWTPFSFEKG